jgi:hypothetical protein
MMRLLKAFVHLFIVISFCFILVSGPARAQEKLSDNMEIVRQKVAADKKLFVATNMGLTEKEAEEFWPVYDDYQKELGKIADRTRSLLEDYARMHQDMTDPKAISLMEDYIMIEEDRVKLMKFYFPKFRKVLPGVKVARYYQIENKIDALINFDAARKIPLMGSNS